LIVYTGLFVLGLAAVSVGAEFLVRGSSRLAKRIGISPLVIGLTVVAFGTSAPELVITGMRSLEGDADFAVGNVMGSTVANVGLIVGLAAVVRPMKVQRRILLRETPIILFVLALVIAFSLSGVIGRGEGVVLTGGWALYVALVIRWALRETREGQPAPRSAVAPPDPAETPEIVDSRVITCILFIIMGLGGLVFGADWLVTGAKEIALSIGVPDSVVAATIVAVGTSLPELAATVAAAFHRMGDLATGNIVGSNVFNLGLVLGSAALLNPLAMESGLVIEQVVPALLFSAVLIPLALARGRIGRGGGGFLLALYALYVTWLLAF